MGVYRTAMGKSLDMTKLVSKNERAKAVGNMKVNARGDTIDSKGNIIVPVTKKTVNKYKKTVANRASNNQAKPETDSVPEELQEEEFTAADLGFDDDDSIAAEEIKAKENTGKNKK